MGNRQAESAATKLAGWRRIHLMKLLEQARLLFGRQPDAGIGDVEANPPWTRHLHGETDFSGWRELHRIAEQVRNHLADAQRICLYLAGQIRRHFEEETELPGFGEGRRGGGKVPDQAGEIEGHATVLSVGRWSPIFPSR